MKPLFILRVIFHFFANETKLLFKFFEYIFLFFYQNIFFSYLFLKQKNYKIVRDVKKNILKKFNIL